MMKKYLFFLTVATATLCASCDNNSIDDILDNAQSTPTSGKQENNNDFGSEGKTFSMLEFATETDFQLAVENPETALTHATNDFKSLYDEYDSAWEIEEEYYATDEKYEEFKQMFPHLYFPEYEDDYSFFLPISDENIAKLVNPEGNVMIGGQIKNYIDIRTPERLLELGKLCPTPQTPQTRSMDHTTVFLNAIPTQINDSNDRKMYASASLGSVKGRNCVFITITFRKKGPRHWKKYNSDGMLMGVFRFAQGPNYIFVNGSRMSGRGEVKFEAFPAMGFPAPWPCVCDKATIGCSGLPGEFYMRVDTSKL